MSVATPWPLARRPWAAQHHGHLAERVGALGDRPNLVAAQLGLGPGRLADGAEDRVHRPVAGGLADRLPRREGT